MKRILFIILILTAFSNIVSCGEATEVTDNDEFLRMVRMYSNIHPSREKYLIEKKVYEEDYHDRVPRREFSSEDSLRIVRGLVSDSLYQIYLQNWNEERLTPEGMATFVAISKDLDGANAEGVAYNNYLLFSKVPEAFNMALDYLSLDEGELFFNAGKNLSELFFEELRIRLFEKFGNPLSGTFVMDQLKSDYPEYMKFAKAVGTYFEIKDNDLYMNGNKIYLNN